MRHRSSSAVVVALWALVSLAGCSLLPPGSQPKPQSKRATVPAGKPGSAARSAAIAVRATDAEGGPMGNVLVLLHALDAKPERDDAPAVLDILDRRAHEVYSFSKARPLSLHLAAGDRGAKLKFSRAGVVALGCKIFNDMRGYIYVTDAAYFGTTDSNGFVRLSGIAPGSYRINVWRADRIEADPKSVPRKIVLEPGAEKAVPVKFQTSAIAAGARATPKRTQPKAGKH